MDDEGSGINRESFEVEAEALRRAMLERKATRQWAREEAAEVPFVDLLQDTRSPARASN